MFEHIRSLQVSSSEIWKCDLCQFETMYKCNLVNHMKKMHDNHFEMETSTSTNPQILQQAHQQQPSSSSAADDDHNDHIL